MTLLALALLLASSLGGPDAREAAQALADSCQDARCVAQGMVYGKAESGLSRAPKPFSTDAKDGTSCSIWQTPCALTKGRSIAEQARLWTAMRARSLAHCGNLSALASGACGRATKLVQAREAEASAWLYAITWANLP
jgi:hypothetical protein